MYRVATRTTPLNAWILTEETFDADGALREAEQRMIHFGIDNVKVFREVDVKARIALEFDKLWDGSAEDVQLTDGYGTPFSPPGAR